MKHISTKEALKQARYRGINISLATLTRWLSKNPDLGWQYNGRGKWYINSKAFCEFLRGKNK